MTDEAKTSEPRDYVVLVRASQPSSQPPTLIELGVFQAGGGHGAIRKAREQEGIDVRHAQRMVAVPVRNWTETEVGLEKVDPKVKLRDLPYVPPAQRSQPEAVEEPEAETEPAVH
jgi:hypothetical protein